MGKLLKYSFSHPGELREGDSTHGEFPKLSLYGLVDSTRTAQRLQVLSPISAETQL